jgi:hypothetical protein
MVEALLAKGADMEARDNVSIASAPSVDPFVLSSFFSLSLSHSQNTRGYL